jgi:hypothetical protein
MTERADVSLARLARSWRQTVGERAMPSATLVRALCQGLPPPQLLRAEPFRSVGSLIVLGILRVDYFAHPDPFQGDFWRLVLGAEPIANGVPTRAQDIGISLEQMFSDADMVGSLCSMYGLSRTEDLALSDALGRAAACETEFPTLARSLGELLLEDVGMLGLARVLSGAGHSSSVPKDARALVADLLDLAGVS